MPKTQKGFIPMITKFKVAPIYFLPMQYAVSLINQGIPQSQAAQQAIDRFAYYGKRQNKRLKDFDKNVFTNHLSKFINTPNAVLVRKSPKHR